MKTKTEPKPAEKKAPAQGAAKAAPAPSSNGAGPMQPLRKNPHGIPDYRAEVPNFHTVEKIEADGRIHYEVTGNFDTPVPDIRESKYLTKEQSIEIYRYMWLNRKMENALEILFKQQKVI